VAGRVKVSGQDTMHSLPSASGKRGDASKAPESWRSLFGCPTISITLSTLIAFILFLTVHTATPPPDVIGGDDPKTHQSSVVQTSLGAVRGQCNASSCRYLNVPFAEEFARFESSQVRKTPYQSEGVGGAEYGPACMQFTTPDMHVDVGHQSEDCLQLNIFTPAEVSHDGPLPTMLWVPGGGFQIGGTNERDLPGQATPSYDGARLAAKGVIVVTINYRLGVLGFFPQADGAGGANGFGDMVNALKWVHEHIHRFGGSPDSVTIFGQSAGSVSVCTLAHLPQARGLFQRVIAESGTCFPSGDVLLTALEAQTVRKDLLARLGSHDLNTMPATELVSRTVGAYSTFSEFFKSGVGAPAADGHILPDMPTNLPPLPVDMMLGIVSKEIELGVKGVDLQSYFSRFISNATVQGFVSHYNANTSTPNDVYLDACCLCEHVAMAHKFAARDGATVHFYIYDFPHNAAFHSQEVPAVFGNGGMLPDPPPDLVQYVQNVWVTFAGGGNITAVEPRWPRVRSGSPVPVMVIGEPSHTRMLSIENDSCPSWVSALNRFGVWEVAKMCAGLWGY